MNNATIKQQSLYTGTLNIQWREGDKTRLSRLVLIVQMLGISTIHWMNECSVDTCYVKGTNCVIFWRKIYLVDSFFAGV